MRKLFLAIIIFAILITGILYLVFDSKFNGDSILFSFLNIREIATPPADLIAAKARWSANPIPHYRLRVRHYRSIYPYVNCLQDVEVINENIAATFEDSCSDVFYLQRFKPLGNTVTELFTKFQKETTALLFKEQDNPGCGWFRGVDITYSSAGYPISATYSWFEASTWTLGPQTYKRIYGSGPRIMTCMGVPDTSAPAITITLQPLP